MLVEAVDISVRLISLAVFFQALEFWQLRRSFAAGGPWPWQILRDVLPSWLPLDDRKFRAVLVVMLVVSFLMIFNPQFEGLALLTLLYFLVQLRFRGPFNGGSDHMTFQLLLALTLSHWFPHAAPVYIAALLTISYLVAGWVKLIHPGWRSGKTLQELLLHSSYPVSPKAQWLVKNAMTSRVLSLSVILFECSFPVIFWKPEWTGFYLAMGALFHLANAWALGLNRFFWTWIAGYPVLWAVSLGLSV